MQKVKLIATFLIALNCNIAFCETKIKLGAILPLSGPGAAVGDSCKKAMELKFEDLNKEKEKVSLEIVFEDDQMVSKNTLSSYRKLKDVENVNAVLCTTANPCNALKPTTESEGTVLIAGTSDNRIIENAKNSFLYWLPSDTFADSILKEALARGIKRIAMITDNSEGPLITKKYFEEKNKGQITIAFSEITDPTDSDFRSVLNKMKLKNFDAIFGNLSIGRHALMMKQARTLNIKQPYFTFGTIETPNELKSSNGALEGSWYVQIADGKESFRRRFSELHPKSSLFAAAQCYDLVGLLNQAANVMDQNNSVYESINSIKSYEGEGGTIVLRPDKIFQFEPEIKEIRDNTFQRKSLNLLSSRIEK